MTSVDYSPSNRNNCKEKLNFVRIMILRVVDYLCGSKQNKIVKKINFTKITFLIKSVTKIIPLGLL